MCWLSIILCSCSLVLADPGPGDIFKRYTYTFSYGSLGICMPNGTTGDFCRDRYIFKLDIGQLKGATRAEISAEYWGGHIGTSNQDFKVNGHNWIPISQPENTPTDPHCYFRTLLGNPAVPVPLEQLKPGVNEIEFRAGPQLCYNFNNGFYWLYSFTIFIYYDKDTPHPAGKVTQPASGSVIGDNPVLQVSAESSNSAIKQVDFIGCYEDFDFEGNGRFQQWHYQVRNGLFKYHIGTSFYQPYTAAWDTSWLPDQDKPIKIMACITDSNGVSYMTAPAENIRLKRNRSVKMYKTGDVPEYFGVHWWHQNKSCKFTVPDDISRAVNARLVLSTWSMSHAKNISFNGQKLTDGIGKVHDYSLDVVAVPVSLIKKGVNILSIFNDEKNHPAEINWPGPVLLIEFQVKNNRR